MLRSPVPASQHLLAFATQAKPARFESAGASVPNALPFGFNLGARGEEFAQKRCADYTAICWTIL